MFKFIFVMFFMFLILLFLLGFSVLRTFKNILFGKGSSASRGEQRRKASSSSRQHNSSTSGTQQNASIRKKIIGEDEGEYVDYEEVKTSERSR